MEDMLRRTLGERVELHHAHWGFMAGPY
jgi:hypothetical protein